MTVPEHDQIPLAPRVDKTLHSTQECFSGPS